MLSVLPVWPTPTKSLSPCSGLIVASAFATACPDEVNSDEDGDEDRTITAAIPKRLRVTGVALALAATVAS